MIRNQTRVRHLHRVGIARRELLQVGFLGALGICMGEGVAARAPSTGGGRAKRVILVWMPGGPPHMHLWDPKPDSPTECKGSARPIPTSAPGVSLGHWLPKTARLAHRFALVRTLTMNKEDENHIPGHQLCLGGIDQRPATFKSFATRNDWPSIGSFISALRPNTNGLPTAIHLPLRIRYLGAPVPGESAGWLGSRYDPWILEGDPNDPNFRVPDLQPMAGFTVERLEQRQRLLAAVDGYRRDLDRQLDARQLSDEQQKAFRLITAPETHRAFDLAQEPTPLRERYGRTKWGQSLLLARRLAEAGVTFVQVNIGGLNAWDFHRREDYFLERMMPPFDQAFSAFLTDLDERGMLADTLVLCLTEMGRNPVLGKSVTGAAVNAADPDGRNHWQFCWSGVFAGAGVRGGTVVGESDEWAGYPDSEAYYPSDVAATVYSTLGIDPRSEVHDLQGRPMVINQGEPIRALF
mgnify:CR=1 FL=1